MSLLEVDERVRDASARAGRDRAEVTLVAVSKGQSVDAILRLYEAGHRDFGENRAQDLRDKVAELPGDIRWHFVGPLQSNKVRIVRPAATVLHSLDRESLALAWLKGPGQPPPVYLQVNIGSEDQKSGVEPEAAAGFCDRLVSLGISVVGLMAIPPLTEDAEDSRKYFVRLRRIRDAIAVDHPAVAGLSMGMSDDFEVAISEGATAIRVGRAIFAD
ncbi:MAG: YggS family pyridoxal phosphate-dependent enzyme [Acidimicrobiia bacterium]